MPGIIIPPNRNICYNSLITVFYIFQYLKYNCAYRNKSSSSRFYIPGITISQYKNMLYFTVLNNVFHAFQYSKDNCSSRNKSSFSRFCIPGIIIPPYRNMLYSKLLITGFHAFPYSKVICSSGRQIFSLLLFNAWHNYSTLISSTLLITIFYAFPYSILFFQEQKGLPLAFPCLA